MPPSAPSEAKPIDRPPVKAKPSDGVVQAVDAWNDLARDLKLPICAKITTGRRRDIGARLRDDGGIEAWHRALDVIRASPFCLGANNRGWRANIDWLASARGFTRLIEGALSGPTDTRSSPSQSARTPIMQAIYDHAARLQQAPHSADHHDHYGPIIEMGGTLQ